ncbi:MAG: acetyl-CoA hydrolase/transferase family protein [Deltaproteobacteria bacterium]|nr:acetyl-CoA hydrolase/transferase family protein [Deltaproteobacteria bacterium]
MPKKSLDEILKLFRPTDTLAVPLATGQPMALMNALSNRTNWKRLEIFTGLLGFPYPILTHPNVHMTSGYYGPIERYLNEQGSNMEYLPANFSGFEYYALKTKPRIIAATLSAPDKEGFLTFSAHCGAIDRPFRAALKNPEQIAIAEINPQAPVVYGHPDYGDNKIHQSELTHYFEADQTQMELPAIESTETEKKIADNVMSLIEGGATLQFGIGGIPNEIASKLAAGPLSDFGIHSEMISDGFLKMFEAGKISNRNKGIFESQSVFTFALGSRALYDFLDERNGKNKRQAVCLPVTIVNDPSIIAKNKNMVSINSGLMVDFAGQVCSEAIGLKQYSGVGGQLQFVEGAYNAPSGKSIMCIKSTATVNGKLISNIVPTLPPGSIISTPRHFTQYVVTEYGVADLYGVSDEKRGEKLIAVAHPDFRDELMEQYRQIKIKYYKS